ncbi:MAG: helix-turn-helix transcriptional regulator [Piscirickettsiaceae bacterium]|nr:helix-turn-helix transcriptional regulator [Piscirickettsiaceae bacterium]
MSQTKILIKSLKKLLRSRGVTYADIAQQLELSETSIKRMFSHNNFSLNRLSAICGMIEMDFVDLLRVFDDEQEKITHLSSSQEQELVSDLKFLVVALCVQNTWTFKEIVHHYTISETECISYLIRLDRLGIIQLLPNNKIRRMVAQDFQWLPSGPIETFFEQEIQSEFLHSHFIDAGEQRVYLSGSLSNKSIDLLNKKIEMLINEFSDMQNDDAKLPVSSRQGVGLLLAIRPWESTAFQQLKRNQ